MILLNTVLALHRLGKALRAVCIPSKGASYEAPATMCCMQRPLSIFGTSTCHALALAGQGCLSLGERIVTAHTQDSAAQGASILAHLPSILVSTVVAAARMTAAAVINTAPVPSALQCSHFSSCNIPCVQVTCKVLSFCPCLKLSGKDNKKPCKLLAHSVCSPAECKHSSPSACCVPGHGASHPAEAQYNVALLCDTAIV